jgi:hypothetical protein
MAMDEWLKGVIAGAAAVLISTALSMRTTEKLIKEAEIDFANPEFGVTPAEDFTDSTRQNLSVGGYTFNAESPSGDDPMMADPTEEGGPAELFDESVVQDEQDGGVDFMNAENSSKIKDYILVDQSGSTMSMSIAMSAIVRERVSESMDAGHDVEIIGYDTSAHPYTEDPREYLHTSRGGTLPYVALGYIAAQNGGKLPTNANYHFIIDDEFSPRSLGRFDKELNKSNTDILFVTTQRGYFGDRDADHGDKWATRSVKEWNKYNTGIPMSAFVVKTDKESMDSYENNGGKFPKGFKFGYIPHQITKMERMNAESPLEESPLTADPLTEDPSDMGGPEDFSAENYSSKDARRARYIRRMQGYNDKQDESLGMRHRGKHQQSMKDRRDEASAMDRMHSKMGRKYDDVMTMDAEARRWRLPKTSKGTALYAKRDKSGKFTDIQNVARSARADRARIAANQGVKSGQGDEGERMIYNAEFTNLTDHVSAMYAAESEDLILCSHCDKKMSECGEHYTETYEASSSYNPYPVFMKSKDAAAVFAKNKNKLCTVTFVKKDGTMRTMKGRTGVFRDKSGKTIVGTGKKPSWNAKARADAGYMTFFDIDAARKAGDNRKGFRVINLNTISEIKAMGQNI